MKIYICDRCGATTSCNNVKLYNELTSNNNDVEYDLCDDCLKVLHTLNKAFINNDLIHIIKLTKDKKENKYDNKSKTQMEKP